MLSILMGMVRKPKYLFLEKDYAGLSKRCHRHIYATTVLKVLKSRNVGVIITGEFDNIQYSEFNNVLKL